MRPLRVQLVSLPDRNSALGTKMTALSNVSTCVDRILMRRTMPLTPPTSITSPSRRVCPKMTRSPLTKLLMMFWRPKPMPTDKPPATTAMLVRLNPSALRVYKPNKPHRRYVNPA